MNIDTTNIKIIICDFDSDSSMYDPKTGERFNSENGIYLFVINNQEEFIGNLITNNFKLRDKVFESLEWMMNSPCNKGLYNLESGFYEFGNYCITVLDNPNYI